MLRLEFVILQGLKSPRSPAPLFKLTQYCDVAFDGMSEQPQQMVSMVRKQNECIRKSSGISKSNLEVFGRHNIWNLDSKSAIWTFFSILKIYKIKNRWAILAGRVETITILIFLCDLSLLQH